MKLPNKVGGGARTNLNGLRFEQTTDLIDLFRSLPNYSVDGSKVYREGTLVGYLCGKHDLYKYLFDQKGVDHTKHLSKKLLPDEAILVGDTVYIIEKKFQSGSGSVDEKLQTCDFKLKQYTKLTAAAGLKVQYIYILNDWFNQPAYKDVHDYIRSVGCKYFFNEIPLSEIGLGSQ